MRTENQIQSKINELTLQRRSLESRLATSDNSAQLAPLKSQLDRLDDMILMLEWVLNAPTGKYHA